MSAATFSKRRIVLPAVVALIVGVAISLALGRLFYVEESRAIKLGFKSDIDQLSGSIEREVLLNLEILYALKAAVGIMPEMTPARFGTLTRNVLDRSPAIQAFAWAPLKEPDQLTDFIRKQSEDFQDFNVTETGLEGLVPVKPRDFYVPVQYIEPLADNRAALGFDLASEESRFEALSLARATGEMVATAGIRLVQEPEDQKGFLVFAPLYKIQPGAAESAAEAYHYGFINGVFRVGELVEQAVGSELRTDLLLEVIDRTNGGESLLYRSRKPSAQAWRFDDRYRAGEFEIAGRQWSVEAVPSAELISEKRGVLPVFVSSSGIILVCVVVGYFLAGARRNLQLSEAKAKLERISLTDSLTGLANRRHFDTVLEHEIRRANREKTNLSLIMIDIDFFKEYNDEYGHPAGDHCLRQVAGVLRDMAKRPGDLVARYGGEEFAIILPDTDNPGVIAESCRRAVLDRAIPHALSSIAGCVTISLGVAMTCEATEVTAEELVDKADTALYGAKDAGRNRVCRS
ncbi:diguanylate cyclase [Marinobacter sp. BW6]|uniref:diguanylate cyclase domain-containing protein n=1 Tax=Marinobacter sp. BW6 TaxID=2592624 RepID=UPI0011DEB795|nr:diguanylate cyclase [Marinobacter sp. BW6]TYC63897.1 diguanylate cyclase [Marinobacter sp. BW6]